jgi:hypothetical protein
VNPFFDELGERLAASASREGAAIEPPTLDPEVARELLELARVVAHTQERRFAPLSAYLAGVAAERLRASVGTVTPAQITSLVHEVRTSLEEDTPPA